MGTPFSYIKSVIFSMQHWQPVSVKFLLGCLSHYLYDNVIEYFDLATEQGEFVFVSGITNVNNRTYCMFSKYY